MTPSDDLMRRSKGCGWAIVWLIAIVVIVMMLFPDVWHGFR